MAQRGFLTLISHSRSARLHHPHSYLPFHIPPRLSSPLRTMLFLPCCVLASCLVVFFFSVRFSVVPCFLNTCIAGDCDHGGSSDGWLLQRLAHALYRGGASLLVFSLHTPSHTYTHTLTRLVPERSSRQITKLFFFLMYRLD